MQTSTPFRNLGLILAASTFVFACGDTPAPTVSISVSPDRFPNGGSTQVSVAVTDFELATEDGTHHSGAESHQEEGTETGGDIVRTGHYHIYLDSLDTNPLKMSSEASIQLTVTATVGAHSLIVRLHGLDHRIIEPQITDEAAITLE